METTDCVCRANNRYARKTDGNLKIYRSNKIMLTILFGYGVETVRFAVWTRQDEEYSKFYLYRKLFVLHETVIRIEKQF